MKIERPECDHCGKPADFNFQDNWVIYEIVDAEDKDGEYTYEYVQIECENVGENLHLCVKCAEEMNYI